MDFRIISNTRFSDGTDIHRRVYSASRKRNGNIAITNILSGAMLFIIPPAEITVEGNHIRNLAALQDVIYNAECVCDTALDDGDFKIFDQTFDNTFE